VNQLNSSQVPTDGVEQEFALLQLGTDYAFVKDATNVVIGIELTEAIPDTEPRALAVSYQNVDGWLVGGTYQVMEVLPGTPGYPNHLLLEMLKAPDPDPQGAFASTWHLEMRNVYDLGFTNMDGSSLEIDIVDVFRLEDSTPEGSDVPYLQIFGLDQTDAAGTGDRDGLIDLAYVNLARGLLIVPSLQPFHPDPLLVDAWTGGQFAFTGLYAPQYDTALAIYNEKLTPTREGEVSQYIIRVLAKGAATR
jgi:cell surface protein SprA